MGLTNDQYNLIQREYDKRRLEARHTLEMRTREVEKRIPGFKKISERMAENSIRYAKLSLSDEPVNFEELQFLNHSLAEEKETLLKQYGYPADYLKMKYHCPRCKDTGMDGVKKCRCFQQAVVDLLYAQSFLQIRLKEENFTKFRYDFYDDTKNEKDPDKKTPRQNIRNAVSLCKRFVASFSSEYHNMLIYGKTGVGKTFLSNCIAKELLEKGYTVIYLTAPQLFEIIEKYKFSKNKIELQETAETKMQYILDCDLLVIDDLGTEFNNSFVSSQFYYCIQERFLRQKSVVISTNLSLEEIRHNYSDRIFSRLLSDYISIKIYGEDIRIKKQLCKY